MCTRTCICGLATMCNVLATQVGVFFFPQHQKKILKSAPGNKVGGGISWEKEDRTRSCLSFMEELLKTPEHGLGEGDKDPWGYNASRAHETGSCLPVVYFSQQLPGEAKPKPLTSPFSLSIKSKLIGDTDMSREENWAFLIGNTTLQKEVPAEAGCWGRGGILPGWPPTGKPKLPSPGELGCPRPKVIL